MADATAPNIGVAAALAVPSYRRDVGFGERGDADEGEEGLPARRRGQPCRPTTAVLHVIPVAAELAGVYPQVLRAYRRKGLLSPTCTEGGTRRHSAADIDRLRSASASSPAPGLNLEGVRRAPARGGLGCLSRKPNRLARQLVLTSERCNTTSIVAKMSKRSCRCQARSSCLAVDRRQTSFTFAPGGDNFFNRR